MYCNKVHLYRCILIFSSLLLFSCNDPCKPPQDVDFYDLTDDVRDFGVFQTGTYWVYQNDSTLQIDSVAVGATQLDTLTVEESCIGITTEYFITDYVVKFDATLTSSLFADSKTLESQLGMVNLISILPNQVNLYNSKDTLSNLLDSMDVDGKIYYNVYAATNFKSVLDDSLDATYYSARNFGTIKKLVQDSTYTHSWSLIRSHIIQ